MPRISPLNIYAVVATPSQYEEGVKYTRELLTRARDLCRELDLPLSELRVVADHLDNQMAVIVNAAEDAKVQKRYKAVQMLRRKGLGAHQPIMHQPTMTLDDGLDDLTDEELKQRLKDAGIDILA